MGNPWNTTRKLLLCVCILLYRRAPVSAVHGVHRILQTEDHEEYQLHDLRHSRIATPARRGVVAVVVAHVSSVAVVRVFSCRGVGYR